jgi:GDPmannose 4,6-dehydratase
VFPSGTLFAIDRRRKQWLCYNKPSGTEQKVWKWPEKIALITGVTGQDGACLAEFLLERGYTLHGAKHRSSSLNTSRLDLHYRDPHEATFASLLHYGDITRCHQPHPSVADHPTDGDLQPRGANNVQMSFETPEYTADALRTLRLLEAIRILEIDKRVGFY